MSGTKKSIILLVIIIVVGLLVVFSKSGAPQNLPTSDVKVDTTVTAPASTDTNTPSTVQSSTEASYTLSDVAKHNTEADCWTAINGDVYDVTAFFGHHPGGDRNILRICGIDGSNAFNRQHGGQSRPENTLATFKIGVLK